MALSKYSSDTTLLGTPYTSHESKTSASCVEVYAHALCDDLVLGSSRVCIV